MGYVGEAVKGVLNEVGTSYLILRSGGNLSGEYLQSKPNSQVTKPFIREYFLEAVLPYDTEVIAGDIISFDPDGRSFIIMNRTAQLLENTNIYIDAVLYKCNVSGELQRFSGEGWHSSSYKSDAGHLETVYSECHGLLTEKLFGTDLEQDEELGQLGIEGSVLYLPHSRGAQPLDRYQVASGEFYKIEVVETRKFDSVDVCHVVEDTREY